MGQQQQRSMLPGGGACSEEEGTEGKAYSSVSLARYETWYEPYSFEEMKVDLEQSQGEMIEAILARQQQRQKQRLNVTFQSAEAAQKLRQDMLSMLSALTPSTYLQLVGHG